MNLLQMSFSGGVLILVIVVLRALLMNRLPKKTFIALWLVALLRLLIPAALPSPVSVYRILPEIRAGVDRLQEYGDAAELQSTDEDGLRPAGNPNAAVSGAAQLSGGREAAAQKETASQKATVFQKEMVFRKNAVGRFSVWEIVYLAGVLVGLSLFAVTYFRCYREFCTSLPAEHEMLPKWYGDHPLRRSLSVRQSDRVDAPLSYGILRPVILLPKQLCREEPTQLAYVLEHEYVHIRRYDGAVKIILAVTLCLHWFNPLVWVMYILFNRDMELSCDETVVHRFGEKTKSAYARMLIAMEEKKSGLMPFCSSFSKNAIEERIVAIMKMKKHSLAAVFAAVVLTVSVGGVFATSAAPENEKKNPEPATSGPAVKTDTTTDRISADIDKTEEDDIFDGIGGTWEELLSPYEPFGLTWEYQPDKEGNGLKMYYNGKEVRGIWDQEKGIWITEHSGISAYAEDAVELSVVYENGVLSGLEEAAGAEGREWDVQRKATSVAADLAREAVQQIKGSAKSYEGAEDLLDEIKNEVERKIKEEISGELGDKISTEILDIMLNEIWSELDEEFKEESWEEAAGKWEEELWEEVFDALDELHEEALGTED